MWRRREAKLSLKQQFRQRSVHRRYLAIVRGKLETQTLRLRLVRDCGEGKRGSTTRAELGRLAVTHVRVLEHLVGATLVECHLETGRGASLEKGDLRKRALDTCIVSFCVVVRPNDDHDRVVSIGTAVPPSLDHCATFVRIACGMQVAQWVVMTTQPSFVVFSLVALLGSACGGASDSDSGIGGVAGAGASGGSGGSGAVGGSGGSSGGGATGGSGGSGGDNGCQDYLDEKPDEVTIQFENKTKAPLYVLPKNFGCGQEQPFQLSNAAGLVRLEGGACGFTCEDLQTSSGNCQAACAAPRVLRLEAESSYSLKWSGALYQSSAMPAACWFDKPPQQEATCFRRLKPPAASYTLTAEASKSCVGCSCDSVKGNGFCNVFEKQKVDATVTASIQLPASTSLNVVFK